MTAWLTKQVYFCLISTGITNREVFSLDRTDNQEIQIEKKSIFLHVIIAIILVIVLSSLVLFFTDSFSFASSLRELFNIDNQELVDEHGLRLIEGDFTIDLPGEKLEDTHITGNLYLAQGIGDGSVELLNVLVDGSVLIQGGGLHTIYMLDCIFNEVKVNRPAGMVKLVAAGETVIAKTMLETGARLLESTTRGFEGFRSVEVLTDEQVQLAGLFESIHIMVKDANVEIESDKLEQLVIAKTAGGAAFKYPDGMIITNLYLDGAAFLVGKGIVDQTYLSASGITELTGIFNQVRITAEAGHIDLMDESAFVELIVAKDALNNALTLGENATVAYLELNEAVEVKGEGVIEKVLINAPGSNIEQIPLEIEFAGEVSVFINGHEISSPAMLAALREKGDPGPAASAAAPPAPAPAPTPAPAPAPAPTPTPAPAPAPTPAPEPKPEPKPDPIKTFIVEDGLIPGKKMVIVTLNAPDPQNYKVKVGETSLVYNADAKSFWGEVDKNDALRSKVIVSQ